MSTANTLNLTRWWFLLPVMILTLALAATVSAVAPHPSLEEKVAAKSVATPNFYTLQADRHERGICTGDDDFLRRFLSQRRASAASASPGAAPFRVLAVLVDFSDEPATVAGTYFDSMLFSASGSTVKNYYDEVSNTAIDLVTLNTPSSMGWKRAAKTSAYYAGTSNGMGPYPSSPSDTGNAQVLVEEVVNAVDAAVNFSDYDNDNDGWMDVLVVIHAGSGAEFSGADEDIWSHKWGISPRLKDGVYVSTYTMQPEYWQNPGDMTIGVYCHELAHGFGLPDLYDTDYSSRGIGRWGLMANGSWNGTGVGGNYPAHPCAWSKIQMNVLTPVNVTANVTNQSIGAVVSGGSVYRLWSSGAPSNEYFLVENRQRTGYDAYLPGDGLLIWHVDESVTSDNDNEWYPGLPAASHYLVALEQADGNWALEHSASYGDGGDPFPGTGNKTSFSATTSPSSDGYLSGNSFVAVENISASAGTMTADLIVGLVAGVDPDDNTTLPVTAQLAQNYPNPFNPTTVISYELSAQAHVVLNVYNVLGQRVVTLVDRTDPAGQYSVTWDGRDGSGREVSSGVYFYRLSAGDAGDVKKMILVR